MPWNLNPCFPLVIPSGPRDRLRVLAQSPGSGSGTTCVDLLLLLACRDWGWLYSHLARLGYVCSLLVNPDQLPRRPQSFLSLPFCLSRTESVQLVLDIEEEGKYHM